MKLQTFEAEAHPNNTETFSLYLKENATLLYYKDRLVKKFKETIAVCSENHVKLINATQRVKAGGTYSYHWALKV
jgi:hypothetical protein